MESHLEEKQRSLIARTEKRIKGTRKQMASAAKSGGTVLPADTARRDLVKFLIDQVHRIEDCLALLPERAVRDAEAAQRQKAKAQAAQAASDAGAVRARKLSTREQQELVELPKQIEALEQELADVDAQLGDPALYEAANSERFAALSKRREALPGELSAAYARWEELEEIAEQAKR